MRVSVLAEKHPEILKEVITKYEVGDFCSLHRDNSWRFEREGFRAYAVWITPLNDDYEGGDLYFNHELVEQVVGQTIKNDRRIRHEITEVTKGTRHSLVSWVFRKA
jgi:predicted 2-oxoglutarate/Fe(II)-dependent dioxygenase YbiX